MKMINFLTFLTFLFWMCLDTNRGFAQSTKESKLPKNYIVTKTGVLNVSKKRWSIIKAKYKDSYYKKGIFPKGSVFNCNGLMIDGELIIPCEHQFIYYFSADSNDEGYFKVSDKAEINGELVNDDGLYSPRGECLVACTPFPYFHRFRAKQNNKVYYIAETGSLLGKNPKGRLYNNDNVCILEKKYIDLKPIETNFGTCLFVREDGYDGYALYDITSKLIIPPTLGLSYFPKHNTFRRTVNNNIEVFSIEGDVIIPGDKGYKLITEYDEECYQVSIETKWYGYDKIPTFDKGFGIVNKNGKEITPLNCDSVAYIETSYLKYRTKDGYWGLSNLEGNNLISENQEYTSISYNKEQGYFSFEMKGFTGYCDSNGKVITKEKIFPSLSEIQTNGNYSMAVELYNNNTKYYKVSKGGRYGLTDIEGKEIIPCEMEALESAGTDYLKYKINGFWGVMKYTGKIIIDTNRGYTWIGNYVSTTKRFPFEMDGYKGECNQLGQQVSKIRVAKPKPVSTAASSSTSRLTDCTAFDLKGKVKSCTVSTAGVSEVLRFLAGDMSFMLGTTVGEYSFTQNGKYISNKGEKVIYEGNVLKKIIKGSNGTEYVYKNGRLHRKNENGELFGMTYMTIHEYTYDERGMIIIEKEGELSATGSEDIVRYYSDYELDSHGNWTSRICKINDRVVKGEIRHITYY